MRNLRSLDCGRRFRACLRRGVSLLELTMVLILIATIAWVVLPRIADNSLDAKKNTCYINVRNIEAQVELWYLNNGTWPAVNLGDMGTDDAYFPDGIPSCPVNGTAYTLNGTTHRVRGHDHRVLTPLPIKKEPVNKVIAQPFL